MNDLRVKTHAAIILCLAVLSTSVHTQTEKAGYLRENSEIISLKGENDFRLFDEAFYSNQLFMLGEMHGTANSYRIQELLVEKLKEKTNFRVYVLELSHITAQSLNDYLDSGSEAKLDSVFELLKGSFGYSREYRNIFTNIRRINQKAKPADRIRFIGVDKFAGSIGNFEYLKRLLTESRYKKGKSSILDEVFGTTGNELTVQQRFRIIKELSADLMEGQPKYRKIFGSRFWEFKLIVENFHNTLEIDKVRNVRPLSSQETDSIRDAQMAANFASLYENLNLKDEKLFGFFGREHTYQEAGRRTDWMTARIKRAYPGMKIVSLSLRYMNSNFMIPTYFLEMQFGRKQEKLFFYGGFQNDNSPFVKALGIEDLDKIEAGADTLLFKMNGKKTPYSAVPDLVDEIAYGKSTTDYFDYAVLVRNSTAATPISDK